METSERRPCWRRVLDLYSRLNQDDSARDAPGRSGGGSAGPSRRALAFDVVFAVVLTVLAVTAAAQFPAIGAAAQQPEVIESLRLRADPPPPPRVLPQSPSELFGHPLVQLPSHEAPAFLVALTALPLAVRRRYPLTAFWVVLLAARATHADATWITVLTCTIAAYGAIVHSRNRVLAMGGLVLAGGLLGAGFGDIAPALPGWTGPFVALLSAGVLGNFVRFWRRRLAEMRQEQAEAMRRAVAEERSRIAAELHDVVTHNVSVIVIQAGAARSVMDTEPEQSKQALLAIESGGRAAMAELRHVMGLLAGPGGERLDGTADGLEPQPGLDRLDALVERVRAAGVPVEVAVSPPGPLSPGIDLAAYRVVQEALTNTIKHAPGAAATVTIGHDGDWLEIEVSDTGGTRGTEPRTGGGRGLIGLRERLAVYGGTLDAGRTAGGGFRVKARVPWRSA
ncbi:sensor histidine kinase [Microbispora rosea]|uniref:sensor histidine kinase n=1 Tax=Microbispora rosea TaxID=58117 RepID=UPI003D8E4055